MRFLIFAACMVLVAGAATAKIAQIAPIQVEYFELSDEADGYSLGRYYSDRPNGYIYVEQNGHGGLKRSASFYFSGPAFYADGTVIPGTEDDVLLLDLTLHWNKDDRAFTFTMDEMTISGESLHFDNGIPIEGNLNILPFGVSIDIVLGVGDMNFRKRDTDTFTYFDGVQTKVFPENIGGVWEQAMDGTTVDFIEVPVPEPSMLLGLAAGALVLVAFKGRN